MKSLLKAITNRSGFLDTREQSWGWVGGVRGVYQGQRQRKYPKPDPSMLSSKRILWEGPGIGKSSLFCGTFLFVHCQAVEVQLLLANRTLGNSFVLFCFCQGCRLLDHYRNTNLEALVTALLPMSAARSIAFKHYNHWKVPSLGENSGECCSLANPLASSK